MSLAPSPIKVFPAYARLGIPGAIPECFVREGISGVTGGSKEFSPAELSLLVLDGWLPWRVQQYLFDTLYEVIHYHHPNATEDERLTRPREFVSFPSRDPLAPSHI